MNPLQNIFKWYFRKSSLPYWCILLFDSSALLVSGVLVYWIFNRTGQLVDHRFGILHTLLAYVLLSFVGFRVFRTYSGILRYSSFVDLMRVAYGNALTLGLALAGNLLLTASGHDEYKMFTHTMTVAVFVLATLLMWGMRILVKTLYDVTTSDKDALRVLIYGAMSGGVGLAKSIRGQQPARFILKGFISHDEKNRHHLLMGEKVYSLQDDLREVIRRERIQAVLVSPLRTDDFRNREELQDTFISSGCRIFLATPAREWNGQSDSPGSVQLHEVSVEDLLPREEITVDMDSVGRELTGQRILITGSAGSIGSEMVRQAAVYSPSAMMLIDQAETPEHDIRLMMARQYPGIQAETVVTSICKADRMEEIFRRFRPDYVFHAAAYKHVPMMEDNPSEAVQNNILGTKILADLSVKYGVRKFVMVSTDKAVNPTNVMGCSKRICEIYVQSLSGHLAKAQAGAGQAQGTPAGSETPALPTQFVTTRFGNVLGSNGSVIPLFREQIRKGGPVTVTHPDIIRFFMLIPEACKLVLEAGTKGHGGEIFVFDMGKPVRIADLAKRMIRLSGAQGIEIKYTGLRAGEKLYEEVLNELEGTKPTFHEKIRIAQVREYDYGTVSREIDELIAQSRQYDDMATVRKMKQIVPEFKSNNSVYEALDRELGR